MNLHARVALAHAAVLSDDHIEALALIDAVRRQLAATPGAVHVAARLTELQGRASRRRVGPRIVPSLLSTAEMRVLQLLPTCLTTREIAERLYVSRNTVKSQTISIYRKFGTTSRSGAVEIASAAGLLGAASDM